MTLSEIAATVRSNGTHEESWELLRVLNFPGRAHDDAARELTEWAFQNDIEIDFDKREAMAGSQTLEMIYVRFTPK